MHVFVSGATGFIGYHTVRALLDAGHTVRLGVRNPGKMDALYDPLGIDTSDLVVGEITDEDAINRALDGVDGVVHTAAMVSLDANKADLIFETNVNGTRLVVGGAAERGLQSIIHVSSVTALYDPLAPVLDESLPPAQQTTPYGRSKAAAEEYVRTLISDGANIAITYPATVLGPDDPAMSEGSQGLAIFYNYAFMRTSSGMQVIDVRDLAEIHVRLLEEEKSGPYVVGGHYRSWEEVGLAMERVTGRRLRKINAPGWLVRQSGAMMDIAGRFVSIETPATGEGTQYATQWVVADDRKVREELGFYFRPLEETLADTTRWLAEEGHIKPRWAEKLDQFRSR